MPTYDESIIVNVSIRSVELGVIMINRCSAKNYVSFPYVFIVFIIVFSCRSSDQGTKPSAFIESSMSERAFEIIDKIDYLSFSYTDDGCQARSLYMSMELASNNIPTSSQFAVGYFDPNFDGWGWPLHVAPMIIISNSDMNKDELQKKWAYLEVSPNEKLQLSKKIIEPVILDPSLAKGPIFLSEWISRLNIVEKSKFFATPGTTVNSPKRENTKIISNISEMGKFKISDIKKSCSYIWKFINKEKISPETVEKKRKRLLKRTHELIEKLDTQNMIIKDISFEKCSL